MTEAIRAYCVKCRTQRELNHVRAEWLKNGSPAVRGTCSVCGTAVLRLGLTPAHEGLPKPEQNIHPNGQQDAKASNAKTSKTKRPASTKRSTKTTKSASRTSSAGKSRGSKPASGKAVGKKASAQPRAKTRQVSGAPIGKLVIVESPAKARSVGNFLGRGYTVKASKGHVRDLLVSRLSVDVENNFQPEYRVMNDKRDIVKELAEDAARATSIYLATDPDREGEAIAWHLIAAASMENRPVQRVVFHEITEQAIKEAFAHPRSIDLDLVNAQQARRILDRLVGYQVSELLWEKVRNRLSAGRVQSVALRLIVDREREIEAFIPKEYWTVDARLAKHAARHRPHRPFLARLISIADQDVEFSSYQDVAPHLDHLKSAQFVVKDIKRGERIRKPSPPFTTSTLQQEASRRLGFNAKRTMSVAQQLYEGIDMGASGSVGLITYMRTDSLTISPQAQQEAAAYIIQQFGKEYAPPTPPVYKTSARSAQEAHEAIRPTSVARQPETVKALLSADQYKLYTLIWQRFVASQMESAIYNTLRVDIRAGRPGSEPPYLFRVTGSTIRFKGFLALYEDARDEDAEIDDAEGRIIPDLEIGETLDLLDLLPEQHFTQPPPRYTEASLVRTLEEYGIGRPSTYAPTVAVIQDREYVTKHDKRLIPTDTGKIVNDLLVKWFPDIMDYQFTARMEDQLDSIAEGQLEWQPMLAEFYAPFARELQIAREQIKPMKEEPPVGRNCPTCGRPLVIRYGRFGKFIGCSDYPNCRYTEPFLEKLGVSCPLCGSKHGGEIIVRRSKKGRVFYGCSRYPDCDFTSWKRPLSHPCPNCGGTLVEQSKTTAVCINCGEKTRLHDLTAEVESA